MGCSVLIGTNPKVVMRGLDPRIHAVACVVGDRCADVDCIVVSPSKDGGTPAGTPDVGGS
jgi:hypothetical protein